MSKLTEHRKQELRDLMRTWRSFTEAGVTSTLTCEELQYCLEVENHRPPPRDTVIARIKEMMSARQCNT